MKAAVARPGAGIGAIELREIPVPVAGPGEALVRLRAATLNYRDLIMLDGLLPGLARTPENVPLSCAVGEVVAIGAGVARVAIGDRVSPLVAQGWIDGPPDPGTMLGGSIDGVAREFAVFDAQSLCRVPAGLGDLEAATLPCAGLTAWNALFGVRPVQRGEWVLLQGTGGVSIAALQMAKAAGARVAIVSSSDAKLARAVALGAAVTVNHRTTPGWAGALGELLGAERIAIVVDVVGRAALLESAGLLRDDGVVAGIGMLGGDFSWGHEAAIDRPIARIGIGNRAQHEAMLGFVAARGIRPVVDAVYPLDGLPDALRRLGDGRFFGKIGVTLP